MTSVVLTQAWITNMATPSVSVKAYTAPDRTEALAVTGSVRLYANGRRRIISTPAVSRNLGVTLRMVTDADYALLQSWAGQLLMYRDNQGRKVFGTFFTLDESLWQFGGGPHDVKISFEAVDHSEVA